MATLLRFETAPRALAPRGGANKGPAEILFFTGVRYERRPDGPAKQPTDRKHRKASRTALRRECDPDRLV